MIELKDDFFFEELKDSEKLFDEKIKEDKDLKYFLIDMFKLNV